MPMLVTWASAPESAVFRNPSTSRVAALHPTPSLKEEMMKRTGQAKASCNHAQIGVCHATFNVPSNHNPN